MEILNKKIRETALNLALGEHFSVCPDAKIWDNFSDEDVEIQLKTHKIIAWEPFELYSSEFLINNIESLATNIEQSIKYILKESKKMRTAIEILQDMFQWSDRLGSDEVSEIKRAISILKKENKK